MEPKRVAGCFLALIAGDVATFGQAMGAPAQVVAGSRANAFYVKGLRDKYEPGKPVWITETADAACGGNLWAKTFLDSFRYLDQLGRLAKHGVAVVFHNTLASSEYGLIDSDTFVPRPNYWAALLWHRLMGTTVLDAGPSRPGLHSYAQCTPEHAGSVTLLAIDNSRDQSAVLDLPSASARYTLSASQLENTAVLLNGKPLVLESGGALPSLTGVAIRAGLVRLAPATISFFTFPDARNPRCH